MMHRLTEQIEELSLSPSQKSLAHHLIYLCGGTMPEAERADVPAPDRSVSVKISIDELGEALRLSSADVSDAVSRCAQIRVESDDSLHLFRFNGTADGGGPAWVSVRFAILNDERVVLALPRVGQQPDSK